MEVGRETHMRRRKRRRRDEEGAMLTDDDEKVHASRARAERSEKKRKKCNRERRFASFTHLAAGAVAGVLGDVHLGGLDDGDGLENARHLVACVCVCVFCGWWCLCAQSE